MLEAPSSPIPKLRLAASSLLALVGDIGSESPIAACYNENAFGSLLTTTSLHCQKEREEDKTYTAAPSRPHHPSGDAVPTDIPRRGRRR
jgi:hypothetical protein